MPNLDVEHRLKLALAATVCETTVRNWARGAAVSSNTNLRLSRAARKLGIEVVS